MGDDVHNYEIEILHGVCKKGNFIGHEIIVNIHHHTFWKIKSLMKNDGCNINLITICVVDNQIKIYFVGWDIINIVINWQHRKVDTKTKTYWNHVDNQVDEKRKYQCKVNLLQGLFHIYNTYACNKPRY